jgi:hypothetical protein
MVTPVEAWEVWVGSMFAALIVAGICRELASSPRLATPMGPNRKSFVMLAAFAALCGGLYEYPLWERAPMAQAAPGTEAIAAVAAPVEPPPIPAPAPPPAPPVSASAATAPPISNPSATSSVNRRPRHAGRKRRHRSGISDQHR